MRRAGVRAVPVLAAALALSATAARAQDYLWYESDGSGAAYARVSGPRDSEWTLRVERRGSDESEALYRDGEPVRTWLRSYRADGGVSREAVEEGGSILEERLYDQSGRVGTERLFLDGGVVEETAYAYEGGRLVSSSTTRGAETVRSLVYRYAPDGRLAAVRDAGGGFGGTTASRRGSSASWRGDAEGVELRVFDEAGRLTLTVVYAGAAVASRETREWEDGALAKSSLWLAGDDSETTTAYLLEGPARGEALSSERRVGGMLAESSTFAYDGAGRLARSETLRRGVAYLVEYEYDGEGTLRLETRLSAGVTTAVIRYETAADRVEEQYDGGVLFARVYYADGRRVKEEIMKDRVVARVRTFP